MGLRNVKNVANAYVNLADLLLENTGHLLMRHFVVCGVAVRYYSPMRNGVSPAFFFIAVGMQVTLTNYSRTLICNENPLNAPSRWWGRCCEEEKEAEE